MEDFSHLTMDVHAKIYTKLLHVIQLHKEFSAFGILEIDIYIYSKLLPWILSFQRFPRICDMKYNLYVQGQRAT